MIIVEALDASNERIGEGPIFNVIGATQTDVLDEIGEITFEIPAPDARAIDLVRTLDAPRFRLKTPDTDWAIGLRESISISTGAQPRLTIKCRGLLAELAEKTCMWWPFFRGTAAYATGAGYATSAIGILLRDTGWGAGEVTWPVTPIPPLYDAYDGDTRLGALQKLRAKYQMHLRQGTALRTIDLGQFGEDSGLIFSNVDRLRVGMDVGSASVQIVSDMQYTELAPTCARLFAWGGGQDDGFSRLKVTLQDIPEEDPKAQNVKVMPGLRGGQTTTIAGSTGTHLKVANAQALAAFDDDDSDMELFIGDASDCSNPKWVNLRMVQIADADEITLSQSLFPAPGAGLDVITWPNYYIQHANYGVGVGQTTREETRVFSDVEVVGRNRETPEPDWGPAAIALYDRGLTYLNEHAEAQRGYRFDAFDIPIALKVGQTVRLVFNGIAYTPDGRMLYLAVDENLFVLRIARRWDGSHRRSGSLEVSNLNRPMPRDDLSLVNMLRDIQTTKTRT